MTLIKLEQLSRVFRRGDEEIRALNKIDLIIEQGEFLAITGPSGSGKSTLMHILGLLDAPTSGSYLYKDIETLKLKDAKRAEIRNSHFGFVFQSFYLLQSATALENVMTPLVYSDRFTLKERNTLAEEALAKVALSDRLQHKPSELSGGQSQRVAIARALVNKPSILFADEPTGNLDSSTSKDILNLLKSLNVAGTTIIIVTHDTEVADVTRRKIVIVDGKVEKDILQ